MAHRSLFRLPRQRGASRPLTSEVGALVVGGECNGLGIIRSLGRRGVPVWVVEPELSSVAMSRYTRWHQILRSVREGHMVDQLLALAKEHRLDGWTVFPVDDETAALIARHHTILSECFRLTTPPWDVLRWAYDKRLTYRLAADLGVDYPWTHYPANREDLAALECQFPVILKPAIKEQANHFTAAKAWKVGDRSELLARYDEARQLVEADVIMVQELVAGGGEGQFSYAALCAEGQPIASVTARRRRQYPMDFGRASTLVETIDDPEVEQLGRRLLSAMGYSGLVEVEFKRDSRSGRLKLLDINPRTWVWHTLGRRAGVDFPYLLWQVIQGESVPEVVSRPGVRWVRMSTDLPTVAGEVLNRRLSLGDYARSLRSPLEFAIFAVDDPLPAVVDVPLLIHRSWKRNVALRRATA